MQCPPLAQPWRWIYSQTKLVRYHQMARKSVLLVSSQFGHKWACTFTEGQKLEILDLRRGIVLCSENKGAYQLCSYCTADICTFVFAYGKMMQLI